MDYHFSWESPMPSDYRSEPSMPSEPVVAARVNAIQFECALVNAFRFDWVVSDAIEPRGVVQVKSAVVDAIESSEPLHCHSCCYPSQEVSIFVAILVDAILVDAMLVDAILDDVFPCFLNFLNVRAQKGERCGSANNNQQHNLLTLSQEVLIAWWYPQDWAVGSPQSIDGKELFVRLSHSRWNHSRPSWLLVKE